MSDITIYHNPACPTSRNALQMIRHAGFEPRIVEYLQTPPSPDIGDLLRQALAGFLPPAAPVEALMDRLEGRR